MTPDELADLLKVSRRQLQRLMGEGLPFIPVGAKMVRFNAASVAAWLGEREQCQSAKTARDAGTPKSASRDGDYTAASRQARERRMRNRQKQDSGTPLKLVHAEPTRS
ncbi:MAG: helix-turn-helix domain-containing protein [Rhodospirillales bacterium]|nr:helix-turn-helix domain-containing protein [Rhodospirillales bacterium]